MANRETWIVDLKLNDNSFKSQLKNIERQISGLSGNINIGSSLTSEFSTATKKLETGMITAAAGFSGALTTGIAGVVTALTIGIYKATKNFNLKQATIPFNQAFHSGYASTRKGPKNFIGPIDPSTAAAQIQDDVMALGTSFSSSFTRMAMAFKNSITNALGGKGLSGKFSGFMDNAIAKMVTFSQSADLAAAAMPLLSNPIGVVVASVTALVGVLALATPLLGGLQAAAFNMAKPFLQASADAQQLRIQLDRLGLSAKQIKETLNLGKLPGLNQEQAATGTSKFKASGFDVEQAQALTVAYSKITTSAEQYGRVINALGQILSKTSLSSEELNQQLGEAIPGFQEKLKKAFPKITGAVTAEALNAAGITPRQFVAQLAIEANKTKSPGEAVVQSSIDNLDDSIKKLQASFGDGLAKGIIPFIDSLTGKLDGLVEGGQLQAWGERLAQIFDSSALEDTIDMVLWLGESFVGTIGYMSNVLTGISSISKAIQATIIQPLMSVFNAIDAWIQKIPGIGGAISAGLKLAIKASYDPVGFTTDVLSMVGQDAASKARSKRNSVKPAEKDVSSTLAGLLDDNKQILSNDDSRYDLQKKQLDALRAIADNTKKFDITKSIVGGGNLGANGVTLTDLTGKSTPKSNFGTEATAALVAYDAAIHKAMIQMQRAGAR